MTRKPKQLLMIGEIGGNAEEIAAAFIHKHVNKLYRFYCRHNRTPGRRMGHAGAIISGGHGTAEDKIKYLKECGIFVVESLQISASPSRKS